MKGRFPLAIVVAAACAVAIGVAGVLWAQQGGSAGDTARLVPANAAVYLTVNTDAASRQWVQMAALLKRLGVDDQLRDARSEGLSLADLDWEADIAPFLGGEATLALTGMEGSEPDVLVILSTSNGDRAWNQAKTTFDRLARESRTTPDTRTYRGQEIRIYSAGGGVSLSVTHQDRYLILGTVTDEVQKVLDLASGSGDSLAGQARFKSAREAVTDDPLVFVYVNPSALGEALSDILGPLTGMNPQLDEALRSTGADQSGLAFAASAESKGVRFEWQTVGLDPAKNPQLPRTPDESRFAGRAPADSLVFLAGTNLYEGIFKNVMKALRQASTDETMRQALDEFDQVKRDLGFDVEADLLAHLTRDYAAAFGVKDLDGEDFWLLAMSGVDDAEAVQGALRSFGAWEQREGRRLSKNSVGGVDVTESRAARGGDDAYAYTLTGDELLAGAGPDAVKNAITRSQPLNGDDDFKEAMRLLPGNRVMTLYVNLKQVVALAKRASGADEDFDWEALSRLRSLGVAVTQGSDRSGGVAFLRIAGE